MFTIYYVVVKHNDFYIYRKEKKMEEKTITLTKDELKKTIMEVAVDCGKDDASTVNDPMFGMMTMLTGTQICKKVLVKLFGEEGEDENGTND